MVNIKKIFVYNITFHNYDKFMADNKYWELESEIKDDIL